MSPFKTTSQTQAEEASEFVSTLVSLEPNRSVLGLIEFTAYVYLTRWQRFKLALLVLRNLLS